MPNDTFYESIVW